MHVRVLAMVALGAWAGLGCTGADVLYGPIPADLLSGGDAEMAIGIVEPAGATTAALGVQTVIQWADIAAIEGTVVRIAAQRQDPETQEDIGEPIQIVGDGSVGSGRDAISDGENDRVVWDIAGVRVGEYVIIATIESPDGKAVTVVSRDEDRGTTGVINVTSSLPEPTLTFSAPAAADESVTTGDTFDIEWTDNGEANPDAVVVLGLDVDADHENGNELILVSNQPLSENGDSGLFTFNFLTEDGLIVPDGDYTIFATIDDGANDPVTVEAEGLLLVNP